MGALTYRRRTACLACFDTGVEHEWLPATDRYTPTGRACTACGGADPIAAAVERILPPATVVARPAPDARMRTAPHGDVFDAR